MYVYIPDFIPSELAVKIQEVINIYMLTKDNIKGGIVWQIFDETESFRNEKNEHIRLEKRGCTIEHP